MTERMTAELDLLEHCSVEDISLGLALLIFSPGDPYADANVRRVQRVVAIYVKRGYVVIKRRGEQSDQVLRDWEARAILEDRAAWGPETDADNRYSLSLTDAGSDAFMDDSAGFFDRLFG